MALRQDRGGAAQPTLNDHRRALEQAAADLPPLAIVFGECEFLRSSAIVRLRDAWLQKYPAGDISFIRAAGEGRIVTVSDITRELSGGSLFAKDKLVVVRQADRLLFPTSGKAAEEADAGDASGRGDREKAFVACLEKPAARTWLAIESPSLPRNRVLGKKVAETCFPIPCPQPNAREIPAWLLERAAGLGKRLDDEAIDLLHRAHGQDLGVLAGELEKLALFAGDGPDIDAAMVGEFLTGTIEFDIFGFTNAVEARNARQAVFYARRIAMQGTRDQRGKREDGEKSAHKVLAMVAGTVQGLLKARVALAAGMKSGDFASAEKLAPWRAGKLLEAAGRFELPELRRNAAYTADQMRRAHDTGGDALLSLELLAVKLTR